MTKAYNDLWQSIKSGVICYLAAPWILPLDPLRLARGTLLLSE